MGSPIDDAYEIIDDLRRRVAQVEQKVEQNAEWVMRIVQKERDDLRQQLAEAQATIAALRIANAAYVALAAICPTCGGSGEVDSGGFSPWGDGIDATCPTCQGSGRAYITANTSHGEKEGDA